MTTKDAPKNVYQIMSAVRAELAKEGIGKNQKNAQQGYKFRGIDDLYNAIAPIMARNGLIASPTVTSREAIERTTAKGTLNLHVILGLKIRFIAADNPESVHEIDVIGEGMDTGDKATNKALSSGFKYGIITEFTIPTVGDQDADATTPETSMSRQPVNQETGETEAPKFVTEKEALEIELAVRHLGIDGPSFLKWCKVRDWPEIPRAKLPKIYAELKRREEQKAAEDQKAAAEKKQPEPQGDSFDDDLPF